MLKEEKQTHNTNTVSYKEIGEHIRRYRELRRMTQEELSEACSLSTGYIGNLERGTRTPSLETLAKLCEVLNVSLDELVFGEYKSQNTQIKVLSVLLEDKDPERKMIFLKTVCSLAEELL